MYECKLKYKTYHASTKSDLRVQTIEIKEKSVKGNRNKIQSHSPEEVEMEKQWSFQIGVIASLQDLRIATREGPTRKGEIEKGEGVKKSSSEEQQLWKNDGYGERERW